MVDRRLLALLLLILLGAGSAGRATAAPCPHFHPTVPTTGAAVAASAAMEVGLPASAGERPADGLATACSPDGCVAHCSVLLPTAVEGGTPSPGSARRRPPRGDVREASARDGPWRPPPRFRAR